MERDVRGVRIIISRDVMFDELTFPCKKLDNTGGEIRNSPGHMVTFDESEEFIEIVTDDQGLGEGVVAQHDFLFQLEALDPIEEVVDTDVVGQVEEHDSSPLDLANYQLARDKESRNIRDNLMYAPFAELFVTALTAAQDVQGTRPEIYKEAILSKNKVKWMEPCQKK